MRQRDAVEIAECRFEPLYIHPAEPSRLSVRRIQALALTLLYLVCPGILFSFMLIFRSDNYQFWGDKYHSVLSSHVLFSRFVDAGLLGPLWRDDILSGLPWVISLSTSPFMVGNLAARLFQLSPFGFDLLSHLLAYGLTVTAMYLYVRTILGFTREGAVVAAVMYATNGYVLSTWTGSANDFSATAALPALLVATHQSKSAVESGRRAGSFLSWTGIALLVYFFAGMATIKILPVLLVVLFAYCLMVFGLDRTTLGVALGVAVGLLLYSPWLWLVWDAARVSQRVAPGFMPSAFSDLSAIGQQFISVLGKRSPWFSLYCITVPIAVGVLCSLVDRPRLFGQEPPIAKAILKCSPIAFVSCFVLAVFARQANAAKSGVPVLSGFDVVRFELFAPFFAVVVVGMILDRSMFSPDSWRFSVSRSAWLRVAVMIAGVFVCSQSVYMVTRIARVPTATYPQNVLLQVYVIVYAAVTLALLVIIYKGLRSWTGLLRTRSMVLLVLSLVFQLAIWSGRLGMDDSNRTVEDEAIMSYAERFSVPEDLALLKTINVSDDRVVDLTRPYARVLTTYAGTALPWAGLRTPVGYSNIFPLWYHEFVAQGVHGVRAAPTRWIEIHADRQTNFEALKLLDVKFVLAPADADMAGYVPWRTHDPTGKVIYLARPDVGLAFLSRGWHCVPNDGEALAAIHAADYEKLVRRAVLVSSDVAARDLCNTAAPAERQSEPGPARIEVTRGHDLVTIDVASETGGILTLADVYYPGWHAFVDSVETPILRTYTTLRGVVVDAGQHRVEFIFSPATFWALLWMSGGLFMLLLGGVGGVYWASLRAPNRHPMKGGA